MVATQVICSCQGTLRRLAVCLALFSFFVPSIANCALRFDVFLGYDGLVPHCAWFPITCEVQNDGPGFTGDIEVSSDQFGSDYNRRVRVELPTGTQKRIFIPVFATGNNFARTWNVRLVQGRKVIAEQQQIRARRGSSPGVPIVTAISRTVAGAPSLPQLRAANNTFNSDTQSAAARLQPEMLPDNPLALEGIDLLYLNSEKALALDVPRTQALMAWLQRGGHLVVAVEQASDINGNPWLRDLVPCKFEGTTILEDHSDLFNWARTAQRARHRRKDRGGPDAGIVTQELAPDEHFESTPLPIINAKLKDGFIAIGDSNNALAIEAPRGRGRITVLTFSPEREPFLSWTNREWFWSRMAQRSEPSYIPAANFNQRQMDSGRFSTDGIFGAMIDSKQVRKLPLGWLLVLLGGYLVVIGPFDHYWLKKINRQMLTWVTFPCYVVIFSGLIYLIGFHLRAGDLELNELNIVDILPDSEDHSVFRGQTYLSIYSPVNAQYALAGKQTFSTFRGEYSGNFGAAGERSRASVMQNGPGFAADAYVPVWTSQLFVADWLEPATAPLSMSASGNGEKWRVTITNESDRVFTNTVVVVGGRVHELGELQAGKTKTVELENSQGTVVQQFVQRYGDDFRNAVQARNQSFGGNVEHLNNIGAASMAASFIAQLNSRDNTYNNFSTTDGLDLSHLANNDTAILLAWDPDHSFTEPFNKFKPGRVHRNTLLRLVQHVKDETQ
jgi:hypothetical protein